MAAHPAHPFPESSSSNSLGSFLLSTFAAVLTLEPPPRPTGKTTTHLSGGVWKTPAMAPLREPTPVPPVASSQQEWS